jgi:hypothetical protein
MNINIGDCFIWRGEINKYHHGCVLSYNDVNDCLTIMLFDLCGVCKELSNMQILKYKEITHIPPPQFENLCLIYYESSFACGNNELGKSNRIPVFEGIEDIFCLKDDDDSIPQEYRKFFCLPAICNIHSITTTLTIDNIRALIFSQTYQKLMYSLYISRVGFIFEWYSALRKWSPSSRANTKLRLFVSNVDIQFLFWLFDSLSKVSGEKIVKPRTARGPLNDVYAVVVGANVNDTAFKTSEITISAEIDDLICFLGLGAKRQIPKGNNNKIAKDVPINFLSDRVSFSFNFIRKSISVVSFVHKARSEGRLCLLNNNTPTFKSSLYQIGNLLVDDNNNLFEVVRNQLNYSYEGSVTTKRESIVVLICNSTSKEMREDILNYSKNFRNSPYMNYVREFTMQEIQSLKAARVFHGLYLSSPVLLFFEIEQYEGLPEGYFLNLILNNKGTGIGSIIDSEIQNWKTMKWSADLPGLLASLLEILQIEKNDMLTFGESVEKDMLLCCPSLFQKDRKKRKFYDI